MSVDIKDQNMKIIRMQLLKDVASDKKNKALFVLFFLF